MKNLLIALLLTISTAVLAQKVQPSPTRTSITDDGATLIIQIDRPTDKIPIHYLQRFDIADLNRIQKEWLKYRVFARQGLVLPLDEMTGLGVTIVGLLASFWALLMVGCRSLKLRQIPQQIR
jgi:hypothetical protein